MGTWRLSSMLVAQGQLSFTELCTALVRQAVGGGALDTVLLENDLASEQELIEAIARAESLEPLAVDLHDVIDQAAADELPAETAASIGVCPLCRRGDRLEVLASAGFDFVMLEELAFERGCTVTAYAATDVRVHEARNLIYGEPVPPRLASLLTRLGPRPAVSLRRYARYFTPEERSVVEAQTACDIG